MPYKFKALTFFIFLTYYFLTHGSQESMTYFEKLTKTQLRNREILHKIMKRHSFKNLPTEWWHFTLQNEPFPNQYFNFDVE